VREPLVIGWSEFVDLPDWGIRGLRAKVDTGARTSALHVDRVEERPRGRVRFEVVLDRSRPGRIRVEARVRRRARVRSSSGHWTTRCFVATRLELGPLVREVEIGLVDREQMIHRMLLGRSALAGCWVDPARRSCLGRPARGRSPR
jgi:hypothetical protein